ncbi:MAG TPA: hypothetical protein VFA11_05270 [Acidimicrobiales bacterium]|nr:hypothetical protein [Acidimicrobiales bacterium]
MNAKAPARLLAIMGSGETSPTMVTTHKQLLERVGPPPVPAVLLDTPFGFQENADELSARAVSYFEHNVGASLDVASFRSAGDAADTLAYERTLNQLRAARYVFAGPGSPSYALAQWSDSGIPAILADKLDGGGCVCFASAAALTLGLLTVPVYEIYKVGAPVHWLEGLDLLSRAGLRAAVIPHFNNAEGGTHDTRFCYLGERRLALLEEQMPDDSVVLGVDEHTGCILDLANGTATVVGLGVVTVRRRGVTQELAAGSEVKIEELGEMAAGAAPGPITAPAASPPSEDASPRQTPLMETILTRRDEFGAALSGRDLPAAIRAALDLDDELAAWAADPTQSDELDRGRAALRSMVVALGEAAAGARDPREVVGPFVELALRQRDRARQERRWADADSLRDGLTALGVEIHDTPDGTDWELS